MANKQEIGLSIDVEYKSLGQLKEAIKDTTTEFNRMVDEFGDGSKEAATAQKKMLSIQEEINAKTEAYNERIDNAAKTVSALNATVGGLQGALELTGMASEETQKALSKITAALSIADAVQNLAEFKGAIVSTFTMLKTQITSSNILMKANAAATGLASKVMKLFGASVATTSNAFKVLKGAIIATGIGVLIVVLGELVNVLMDVSDSSDEAAESQKRLEKAQKDAAEAIALQNQLLEGQIDLAKRNTDIAVKRAQAAGKSEEEITKITRDGILKRKKLLEDDLEQRGIGTDQFYDKLREVSNINNELEDFDLDQQIKRRQKLDSSRTESIQKNEQINKILDDARRAKLTQQQLEEEDAIRKFEENKKALKGAGKKAIKAIEEQLQLELSDIRKKYSDEEAKKLEERAKKLEEDAKHTKELQIAAIADEKERTKADNEFKLQNDLDAETERFKAGELRLEQYLINLALIRQRYANDEKARQEADRLAEDERNATARQNTLNQQKAANEALIQAEIELQNKRFDAANAGLALLESLAGENEKIANIIFAVQKGLEIARIITDTARGIVAAKAGLAAVPPFLGAFPNPAFVLAAATAAKQIAGLKIAAATSIASIAAASISKFKGGGGGATAGIGSGGVDTSAPIAPSLSPQVTATAVNAAAINQLGNQATRAYVLNSDIQNAEQRNAYINRNASIGNP